MICFLLVSCFALAQHDMSLAFHGYILQYAGIADEVECRPEIGVDAVGADGGAGAGEKSALRARQGGGLAVAAKQGLIEHRHLFRARSEEHTSELQSRENLVCRLLLEKKKKK